MNPAAPVMNHFEFSSRKIFLPEKGIGLLKLVGILRKSFPPVIAMNKNGFAQKEIGKSVAAHLHVQVGIPMRHIRHESFVISTNPIPIFFFNFPKKEIRPVSSGMHQSVNFAPLGLVENRSEGRLFWQKRIIYKPLKSISRIY